MSTAVKPARCNTPKAVASVREVIACGCGARGRIEPTEDHVKAVGEDIWFVFDQATPGQHSTERQMIVGVPGRCYELLVIGSEIEWALAGAAGMPVLRAAANGPRVQPLGRRSLKISIADRVARRVYCTISRCRFRPGKRICKLIQC